MIIDHLIDAIAVDFLFAEGIIFWADGNLKKIKRIRVSTGEVEDVISFGLKKPEGLAVDWIARKLYWTDCRDAEWETNRIEVANLDGSRWTYSFNCYVKYYFAEYTCPCKLLTLFVSVPNCCKLLFILLENYWDNFLFKFVYFY